MKKWKALVAGLVLTLSLSAVAACGNNGETTEDNTQITTENAGNGNMNGMTPDGTMTNGTTTDGMTTDNTNVNGVTNGTVDNGNGNVVEDVVDGVGEAGKDVINGVENGVEDLTNGNATNGTNNGNQ